MKTATITTIGIAVALIIAACAVFEDRLARVTTPEFASAALSAGCTGGREFIEAATVSLDPSTAALIAKGVETACALRADRAPISATVYDDPLDGFCATTKPLSADEAEPTTRSAFNAQRTEICEARP
jgi:hypothetical protein